MPEGPVVVNNTPLVALWSLGRLDLLPALLGEIWIPPAVHEEFLAADPVLRRADLEDATWIHVTPLANPRRALSYVGLDRGEAEVLALAEEREARLVVIDERRARQVARRMGFALTGTLGLLLLAKEESLLESLAEAISSLEAAGLHLSRPLVTRVLELAGEKI